MGPDPGKPLYRSAAAGSPAAVPLILRPSEIRFCPMENRGGTEKPGSRRTISSRVIGDQSRNRVAFPRVSLPMASRIHKNRDKSIYIADGRNRNGRSSAAFLFYQNRRTVLHPFISSPSPIRLYDRWESRTGFVIPGKTL
nr:hypothetical protein [Bacillaceae bacterium]